jgi:hypothetical protein
MSAMLIPALMARRRCACGSAVGSVFWAAAEVPAAVGAVEEEDVLVAGIFVGEVDESVDVDVLVINVLGVDEVVALEEEDWEYKLERWNKSNKSSQSDRKRNVR